MNVVESKSAKGPSLGERGSALILVFWLLAILSLALFTSIQLISSDMSLLSAQKQDFRATQLCEMGIAIAANPEVEKFDPILMQVDPATGEGFHARIRGEGGRININTLLANQDRVFLERIFTYWGMELEQVEHLIDAMMDWIDADDEKNLLGAEYEWYEAQGFPNYPFNRPFYDLEEMALVKGMDVVNLVKPDWRNYFTLYSGGQLDLQEADAELIELVAEVPDFAAEDFLVTRRGEDGIDGTEDDLIFASVQEALLELGISAEDPRAERLTVNDATVRIESMAQVGDYTKQIVLIVRNRESNPQILNREEIFE